MMIIRFPATSLSLLLCVSLMPPRPAQAAAVRQQFKASVAELQKNPGNKALREKVIKLALKLKPKPAVPEEAERRMARGSAAVESAEDQDGFREAVKEFEKAALAAPWLAQAYYNLGVVQDKAGDYAAAKNSLKLYLLAVPGARNAKKVKSLIYKIEYRMEKAAKDATAKKTKLVDISGTWFMVEYDHNLKISVDGDELSLIFSDGINVNGLGSAQLDGRKFVGSSTGQCNGGASPNFAIEGSISEDNSRLVTTQTTTGAPSCTPRHMMKVMNQWKGSVNKYSYTRKNRSPLAH